MSTVPPVILPPAPIEPGASKGGFARKALIGCGGAALVCVLALVGLMIYVQRRPTALMDFLMRQVEGNFAADVTEEEKQELRAAYADFRKAVEEKRPTDDDYDRVRRVLTFSPGQADVTREQVRELTEAFRDAAAERPAGAPAVEITPMPEVAATPSP